MHIWHVGSIYLRVRDTGVERERTKKLGKFLKLKSTQLNKKENCWVRWGKRWTQKSAGSLWPSKIQKIYARYEKKELRLWIKFESTKKLCIREPTKGPKLERWNSSQKLPSSWLA